MLSKNTLFILVALFFLLFSCAKNEEKPIEKYETPILPEVYDAKLDDEKKVQLAMERRKEQTQIRKGDYMMSKNNPREALKFYLPVLEKLKEDVFLYKKVADAYFGLKDWKNAYAHYVRVPLSELSEKDKENMIASLFAVPDSLDRKTELQKFSFQEDEKQYYLAMSECYVVFQNCLDIFWNYEGSEPKLLELQKITKDAGKISPDLNYRNLLIAQKLYEQKMFRLVGMITAEILANNPNYKEAKKMRAFSLYELWKYEDSRDIMLEYFSENPDDMEVIIRLGEIYTFLGDYVTANLYFNNAIVAGYKPKTILERRLAYNYAKLDDTEWMIKVLSYLLQEEDASEDDFGVAISLAFETNNLTRAYSWAYAGIIKFPNSKILSPLYAQSLRLMKKNSEANIYISRLPADFQNLPMIQLEKWILLFENEKYDEAKKIFQELRTYDEMADFALESEEYLEKISEIELQKASQTEENFSWSIHSQMHSSFWDS